MNITDYTALELGKKIKSGDITVVEATRAFLDEIKAKDGVVNAYITVTEQEALERAEEGIGFWRFPDSSASRRRSSSCTPYQSCG